MCKAKRSEWGCGGEQNYNRIQTDRRGWGGDGDDGSGEWMRWKKWLGWVQMGTKYFIVSSYNVDLNHYLHHHIKMCKVPITGNGS